jgi:hypothetical protein
MNEIPGRNGLRDGATAVAHASYAFACMRCGHGWEQSYEIEHHTDAEGRDHVICVADGRVVPSPLSRPVCRNCEGHVVRIMRAGQVASVRDAVRRQRRPAPAAGPAEAPAAARERPADDRHWHLSDLLHPFHRRAS